VQSPKTCSQDGRRHPLRQQLERDLIRRFSARCSKSSPKTINGSRYARGNQLVERSWMGWLTRTHLRFWLPTRTQGLISLSCPMIGGPFRARLERSAVRRCLIGIGSMAASPYPCVRRNGPHFRLTRQLPSLGQAASTAICQREAEGNPQRPAREGCLRPSVGMNSRRPREMKARSDASNEKGLQYGTWPRYRMRMTGFDLASHVSE